MEHTFVSGSYIEQNIVLNVSEGDRVNKGDVIAYNSGFFEPDEYDPKHVNWKHGVLATVALLECDATYEDSNAISQDLGKRLAFSPAHVREIKLTSNTVLHSIVKVGDHVQTTDLLCVVEDSDIDAVTMSDDPATVEFLSNLNRKAPKAKYSGKIAAIDVLYSCDISDMHSSLQNLVKSINTQKNKAAKFAADSSKSDQFLPPSKMEPGTKYRGLEFLEDTVFIMITISEELNHGLGDKLVVSSQEKSVTAAVMNKPIHTESGIELDMLFSGKSIMNRIVLSPIYQGSLERILEKMEDDIVDIYFGKK